MIYVVSDSLGETAESVAKATISQFDESHLDIIRVPFVRHVEQIQNIVNEAATNNGVVCHTLVSEELRAEFERAATEKQVKYVDLLGPMLDMLSQVTQTKPRMKPGIIHKLDQEYFKKVGAIEFAVKYDDGKNPVGFKQADIVLIGVSRTSKTPLSMYLAHKERIKALGFNGSANYTDISRIEEELLYAKSVMRHLHCAVLDVSNKAIEETASRIMEIMERNKQIYGERY